LIDTHIVVWLYEADLRLIPPAVQRRINREAIGISPFVQLELDYLYERGKTGSSGEQVIDVLHRRVEATVIDVSAGAVCSAATDLTWTRDPFDRLIVAHANVARLPLITRDETIRQHCGLAWWDD
jgi:PIN domain nuclease of toxin-antitoxin system